MNSISEAEILKADVPAVPLRKANRLTLYLQLTKPGIITGNILTAVAGYLFASRLDVRLSVLISLSAGTALIIASSCVWNNYIDRDIDKAMSRTKHRALAAGVIKGWEAWLMATALGIAGFVVLALTNRITIFVGAAAMVGYVVIYGVAKRRTEYGVLVGAFPGAAALLAGYTAVTGRLDITALLLFMIMFTWQIPHFNAIAVRRLKEYANAGLPVWPVKRGIQSARTQTIIYICLFVLACCLLSVYGHAAKSFAIIMFILGIRWLYVATRRNHWPLNTFKFSLLALLIFSVMLPLGTLLP